MPIFEVEEKPFEPKEIWLISYADLVTLMLAFFILLFSFCKPDTGKLSVVAESFRPGFPGRPFLLMGSEGVLEGVAGRIESAELAEETYVTIDERGVIVAFKETALFGPASAELLPSGRKMLERFVRLLYALPNKVAIEGHTDDQPIRSRQYPSNWELSAARAGSVARYLEDNGVKGERMEVIGRGPYNPRFTNESPAKRALNRRVEVIIKPD